MIGGDKKMAQLPARRAIWLYTSPAAHYSFSDAVKDSIEPGELADMPILWHAVRSVPDKIIKKTPALEIGVVGGNTVFRR